MKKPDEPTTPHYHVAQLHTLNGQSWTSLHLTGEDAERKLRLVAEAWGVGFTLDGEPADGFLSYGVDYLPVLTSAESNEPPGEDLRIPLTKEEVATWDWLVMRDVVGGLSAQEMADELGVTAEAASVRLVGLVALDLAHEVSPGRYRRGGSADA